MFLQESCTLLHQRGSSEWQWVQLRNSKAFDSFNYTKETTEQDKKPTQTETSKTNGPAPRNPFGPDAKCKQNRPKDKALKWKTVCLHYDQDGRTIYVHILVFFPLYPVGEKFDESVGEVAWSVNFLQVPPIKYLKFLFNGYLLVAQIDFKRWSLPARKVFFNQIKKKEAAALN